MLDGVKRCKTSQVLFFPSDPDRRLKKKIMGAAFRGEVLFVNQTGELITVTY